jgi:hypothetical protein
MLRRLDRSERREPVRLIRVAPSLIRIPFPGTQFACARIRALAVAADEDSGVLRSRSAASDHGRILSLALSAKPRSIRPEGSRGRRS